jgi:cobalt/nickel transport protein
MKKLFIFIIMSITASFSAGAALAHFGMLIPSDSMVMQNDNRTINVKLSFSHPFEGEGMELVEPVVFGVMARGKKADLLKTLKKTKVMEHTAWETSYTIKRPGVYMFYMEPKPYWEPAEDCYIVHYTKTVVTAFGDDEGWDQEIGLKTEIVPLSKPYGLYTGNVFQGIVKMDGKPVPFGEVEVEYYNKDRKAQAPTDYMVTQTIKADANGVFTYSAPNAGWWGFSALNTSDKKIKGKDVEIGAVLWVKFHDWK